MDRAYLTVPEVAQLLRINRGKAYTLAAEGALPGVIKIGRTIRVDRDKLIEGLSKSEQPLHRQ